MNTQEITDLICTLLDERNFSAVDDALQSFPIDEMKAGALVAAIALTYPAKNKLNNRAEFLLKAEAKLNIEMGKERTESILYGRK